VDAVRLFVYGTLRAGGGLDHLLTGQRQPALTQPGWSLYEYAGGAYPVMIPIGSGCVRGDVIDIDIESDEWCHVESMERRSGYHLTTLSVATLTRTTVTMRDGIGQHVQDITLTDTEVGEAITFAWYHADDDGIGPRVENGDWIEHEAMLTPEAWLYRDARL